MRFFSINKSVSIYGLAQGLSVLPAYGRPCETVHAHITAAYLASAVDLFVDICAANHRSHFEVIRKCKTEQLTSVGALKATYAEISVSDISVLIGRRRRYEYEYYDPTTHFCL